jgi:hypothetical protein
MPTMISLTETQIFTALRSVLGAFGLAPSDPEQPVQIIRGQVNRVPEPARPDFVVLWPITRDRLAMNITTYDGAPNPGTAAIMQETEVTIQADVHGPFSADNAARIQTLFRDQFAMDAFAASGLPLTPLYTSDPRQMPFDNGEQQVEERWTIDLCMQADVTITVPQQFAITLTGTATPVEALP